MGLENQRKSVLSLIKMIESFFNGGEVLWSFKNRNCFNNYDEYNDYFCEIHDLVDIYKTENLSKYQTFKLL